VPADRQPLSPTPPAPPAAPGFRAGIVRYFTGMDMRRGVASVMTALVLVGGGASLTACADPAGNAVTGTPRDQSHNTAGNNPAGTAQGHLPNLSNRRPDQPVRGKHTGKGAP
jgi:hypothetical protein